MGEAFQWVLAWKCQSGRPVDASGTPEQLSQSETSHTGHYLRPVLAEGRSNAYAAGR